LLRYKANAPFARAVVSLVARAVPADATLQYPGDDIVWALFRKL
jgi:hypothetical protein